jgi:hypothetical protein
MQDRPQKPTARGHELSEKRKELHGERRKLHERLAEVCEDFVLGPLTREHKRKSLVRELRYLLDFYQDDTAWEGVA